jgi:hypothetical protein
MGVRRVRRWSEMGWKVQREEALSFVRRDGGPEHPNSGFSWGALSVGRATPLAPSGQQRSRRALAERTRCSTSRKKTGCQEFHANSRTTSCLPVFTICAGTRRK